MPRQYSPKTFLRQVPVAVLKEYFDKLGVLSGLELTGTKGRDAAAIFEALVALPSEQCARIEGDFQQITDMAGPRGVEAILEEAAFRRLDWAERFAAMANHYERAFRAFLDEPNVFRVAGHFDEMDRLGSWQHRTIFQHLEPKVESADLDALTGAISGIYRKEGRGRLCEVDNYLRRDPFPGDQGPGQRCGNAMNRRRPKRPRQHDLSRRFYAAHLHRPACRWDVLLHELSLALAKTNVSVGQQLATTTFRFHGQEAQLVGWLLARGFDLLVGQDWPRADNVARISLWPLGRDDIPAIAQTVAARGFDPLLRKYVWDSRETYAGRPHNDLLCLIQALAESLRDFLAGRCLPGGDLADCLAEPASDAGRYFPDALAVPGPGASPSGTPSLDVRQMGLRIRDTDDGGDVKRVLVHLVRDDPWFHAEWRAFVESSLKDRNEQDNINDRMAIDRATDTFIFRATRLDGKTPIEVLLDRQPEMSDQQRRLLLRWDAEAFVGAFLVRHISPPGLAALDLESGRELRLEATKPTAISTLRPGDMLLSRVVPWDDYWLLSGVQQRYEQVPEDRVREIQRSFRLNPHRRLFDPNDPRVVHAFQIQEEQHRAWLAMFGKDEVVFADGIDLGAAIKRFDKSWAEEILPGTGLSRIESFRRQYGKEPPSKVFALPDDLLDARDVAAIFDRRHGLSFLVGYGEFLSVFEGSGPLSDHQVDRVWEYLSDDSVGYWVFQRVAGRFPERTEQVLRGVLKDESFCLSDLDLLLRRFKGESMRQPVRPMITIVDPGDALADAGPRRS